MDQQGVDWRILAAQAERLRARGASVMYLAVDGRLAGLLAVADPVKASTPEAIAVLRASGLRIVMATGDGLTTAQAVAAQLGIDEVHGEMRPQDKDDLVAALQAQGHLVGEARTARAISRLVRPHAWCRRSTSSILRMDNLLFTDDTSGQIAQGATVIPRAASLVLPSSLPWNQCPVCAGMGVQFAVESVSTFTWNRCPVSSGIRTWTEAEVRIALTGMSPSAVSMCSL